MLVSVYVQSVKRLFIHIQVFDSLIQITMIFSVRNIFPCKFFIPNIGMRQLFEWNLKQRLKDKIATDEI